MRLRVGLGKKILLGFFVSLLLVVIHAAIITFDLRRVDSKLHLVEISDDLTNRILEIRRAEKNFLLYRDPESLDEALGYLDDATSLVRSLEQQRASFSIVTGLLPVYREEIDRLRVMSPQGRRSAGFDAQAEKVRETGRKLLEESERMSRGERDAVRVMIRKDWILLWTVLCISIIIGIAISRLMARRIVLPLGLLERSTDRLLRGDFSPIRGIQRSDEIGSLVEAYNHMVRELQEKQAQLVQSAKLASLGTMTSGAAHELNNPLSNISTSAELLAEGADKTDAAGRQKLLSQIVSETTRAKGIVSNLLDFSRENTSSPEAVSVSELLEHALRLVDHPLKMSRVRVSTRLPVGLPPVRIARGQATQVFVNLLLNAVQAMPNDGMIDLSAKALEGGSRVEIRVRDTGMGISPEDLPRIFDPFFTTKPPGEGTGLGLSVSYGIIKEFGGAIQATSQPGQGTTIIVVLPTGSHA